MRILTLVQAVADGTAAAGLVLFALLATDRGSAPLALAGLALLALSAAVRVSALVVARRRLARVPQGPGAGRGWVVGLWVVQCAALVAGLVLAHSSLGEVAAAGVVGLAVALASAALVRTAARRAGRGAAFVDSASATAYA